MRAMILAAGKGTRMRGLTKNTPKSLLKAAGKPLIQYQLERLIAAGVTDFVINHARFGEQIESCLGNGSQWGIKIEYSRENDEPLETAGGIIKALPLLGTEPFLVVNADVWTDFDYSKLLALSYKTACILLVNNPDHNKQGDFVLQDGYISNDGTPRLTFSGIGMYHPVIFEHYLNKSKLSLTCVLRSLANKKQLLGLFHDGLWMDIGTPERLKQLEFLLQAGT